MKISFYYTLTLFFIGFNIYSQSDKEKTISILNNFSEKYNKAAVLAYSNKNSNEIAYATGFSNRLDSTQVVTTNLFEIGSASKMFTAIAILQLIEQNKLSLKTPISEFYPTGNIRNLANFDGENYFDKVTVEMLLNHTSGLIDYLNVYGDDNIALKIFSVKGKTYSFDEIIKLSVDHGDANFIPGEKFKYCNTGYIILGDIINKITKTNWRDYIQVNIFDKAKMKNTYFGSRIPEVAKRKVIKGYYNFNPSDMPPTLAGSAGEVISTLNDLKKFLSYWQNGKLFYKPETLQLQRNSGFNKMYEHIKSLEYGYGVMRINGFYGHGGQTFGFQSYVTFNPETKNLFIVGVNDASASAMLLFFQIEGIFLQ